MASVDERIVQLGFDNKQFEKGAEQSLKTLDRLDAGLSKSNGSLGLENIEAALEKVADRFSTMGIIGDQVIRRITNSVMDMVGKLGSVAKSLSVDQVAAGWSKYADKTTAVQTIMAATSQDVGTRFRDTAEQMDYVSSQLEKLNWFTDETSYSFLDMVNNIGKFTSQGIKLDDAVTEMQGISTWAALSGQHTSEASRAMYNLSQALATGSVKLMDWKSIENANMATKEFKDTVLETAVQVGTLTKEIDAEGNAVYKTMSGHEFTAAQFNTQLSEGWFNNEVLETTLKQYGDFANKLNEVSEATDMTATEILKAVDSYEKTGKVVPELTPYIKELSSAEYDLGRRAFKAAQEAKTFSEALDATKDAVSTGWMNAFEMIFGNYLEAKVLWTNVAESLYNIFAEPVNRINEVLRGGFSSNWDKIVDRVNEAGVSTEAFRNAIMDAAKAAGIDIDSVITEVGSLEAAFRKGALSVDLIKQAIASLTGTGEGTKDQVKGQVKDVEGMVQEIRNLASGKTATGQERAQLAEKYGISEKDLNIIDANMRNWKGTAGDEWVNNYIKSLIGATEQAGELDETIKSIGDIELDDLLDDIDALSGRELFSESIMNFLTSIERVLDITHGAFEEVFGDTDALGEGLGEFLKGLHSFTSGMILGEEGASRLHDILTTLFTVMKNVGTTIGKIFRTAVKVLGSVLNVAGKLFDSFKSLSIFRHFKESFINVFDGLAAPVKQIGSLVKDTFAKFRQAHGDKIFNGITRGAYQLSSKLAMVTSKFKQFMTSEKTAARIENAFKTLLKFSSKIGNILSTAFSKVRGALSNIGGVLATSWTKLSGFVTSLLQSEQAAVIFEKVSSAISKATSWISEKFGVLKDGFKNLFSKETGSKIGEALSTAFSKIRTATSTVGTALSSTWQKVSGFVTSLLQSEQATAIFEKLSSVVSSVATWISEKFAVIKNGFSNIFTTETLSKIGSALSSAFSSAGNVLGAFGTILAGAWTKLTGFIKSLFSSVDAAAVFEKVSQAISKAATWISEKVALIKQGLGNLFSGVSFSNIIGNLGKLLAAFLGFKVAKGVGGIIKTLFSGFKAFGTIGEVIADPGSAFKNLIGGLKEAFGFGDKVEGFATQLRNIAISVGIMAVALMLLASVDPDRLGNAVFALVTALGSLVGAMKLLEFVAPISREASTSMIKLAASILFIAIAMKILASMNLKDIGIALVGVAGILAVLLGFMWAMDKLEVKPTKIAGIVSLALGILILAAAVKVLGSLKFAELGKGLLGVVVILGAVAGAMALISHFGDSGKMLAAGAAMIGVAIAMLILASAVKIFGSMNYNELEQGMIALGAGLLAMTVALAMISAFGNAGSILAAGVAMVMIAAAMLIMAAAIDAINAAMENWEAFGKFAAVLGIMVVALAGLGLIGPVVLAAGAALFLVAAAMVVAAIGIFLLAGALAAMDKVKIDPKKMIKIAGVLTAFGAAGAVLAMGAFGLLLGGASLLVLAIALNAMNTVTVNPGYLMGISAALMVIGLAGIIFGLGGLGLLLGGAGLLVLAAGLKGFNDVNIKPSTLMGIASALMILGLAGAALTFGAIGLAAGGAALKSLAEAMPAIADGFNSMAGLSFGTIATGFAALGTAVIALFGADIAAAIGGDGPGQLLSLANAMPAIAAGMASFEGLAGETIATASTAVNKAALGLLAGNVATIIGEGGPAALQSLAEAMPVIATGMASFEGLAGETIATASSAINRAALGLLAGNVASIIGQGGPAALQSLADAMPAIATGMASFEGLAGETIATASSAVNRAALGLLAGNVASIIGQGGPAALRSLAAAMPAIAAGMSSFESLSGGTIAIACSAVNRASLSLLGGDIVAAIGNGEGPAALKSLAEAMPAIAEGFSAFSDFSAGTLEAAFAAIGGSIVSLFTADIVAMLGGDGPGALRVFAASLPVIAAGLKSFSDFSGDSLDTAFTAISKSIKSLFAADIVEIIGGDGPAKLKEFGESLPKLAEGINNVSDVPAEKVESAMNTIGDALTKLAWSGIASAFSNVGKFSDFATAVNTLATALNSFPTNGGEKLQEALNVKEFNADAAITNAIESLSSAVDSAASTLSSVGQKITTEMSSGISDGQADTDSAITTVVNSIKSVSDTAKNDAYAHGLNIATGIARGITGGAGFCTNAIASLVSQIKTRLQQEIQDGSPAKVFIPRGYNISWGVATGIDKGSVLATNAMSDLANNVVSAVAPATNVLSTIGEADIAPSIRPVVDMSQVSTFSNAFGADFMGLNANVAHHLDGISATVISRQKGYNSEFQQMIALNKELLDVAKRGGNVYLNDNVIAGMVNRRLGAL